MNWRVIDISCQRCSAKPGRLCVTPRGEKRNRPHFKQIDAAWRHFEGVAFGKRHLAGRE